MTPAHFEPAGPLRGTLAVPGDKSVSHRAALIASMGDDPVRISGWLESADTRSTLEAVRALGALVTEHDDGSLTVRGAGLRGAATVDGPLDVGNAGTLLRLLPGRLAGVEGGEWTLDGDESIRRRPVDRVAEPLRAMGAQIRSRGRLPPLTVRGAALTGIEYELPMASAQVKSCVLLAGLLASERTTVVEPAPSRDHTERMLAAAGVSVERRGARVSVGCQDELELEAVEVPGDPSSAAFHVAAALLVPGSRIVLTGHSANWTRVGFLRIAQRMGAVVLAELEEPSLEGVPASEPVCEVDAAYGPLEGTTVEPAEVPLAIDELPLVALLGCFAEGETVVRGAQELRVKESDRIAAVVGGLRALGADIEATADGFAVRGTGGLRGGVLDAGGDHRMAMLGAVAGLASRDGVEVAGFDAAAVSYPAFGRDLAALV